MDLPRHHVIREGALRICNPFTPEKLATLGEVIGLRPGDTLLDLACGRGELLCTWARDHGVTGTGVDISTVAVDLARRRVLADGDSWDRYAAAHWLSVRRWLDQNPDDELAPAFREELTTDPLNYVRYRRDYLGWGGLRPAQAVATRDLEPLEIEPGAVRFDPAGRDRVYVPFSQQDVLAAVQLDRGTVVRVEEHPVADHDGADVRSDADSGRPGQAPAHRRGRRDDDARGRAAFALGPFELDEYSVVQHPDRQSGLGVGVGAHHADGTPADSEPKPGRGARRLV
jgi:Mycolic acid cyclopropane synthetase